MKDVSELVENLRPGKTQDRVAGYLRDGNKFSNTQVEVLPNF